MTDEAPAPPFTDAELERQRQDRTTGQTPQKAQNPHRGWVVDKGDLQWFTVENPQTRETATVTVRMLDAGDKAEISEIAIGDGSASMSIAMQRLQEVTRAVVDWTLPVGPPTPEVIRRLPPPVLEQIHNGYKLLEGGEDFDHDLPLSRQEESPTARSGGSSSEQPPGLPIIEQG